jgi:acyl-CoA oxidase
VGYVAALVAPVVDRKDLYDCRVLTSILRYNVACNVMNAGQKLQELMSAGHSFKSATDYHMGIILNEVSRTQSNYWTMRTFCEELEGITSPQLK